MALESSYSSRASGQVSAGSAPDKKTDYWPLHKCRKAYTDYLFNKREEIEEQKDARRYYHGSQWTDKQLETMRKRNQPAMTFNRVSRKVNGVVGLIEKLRQDPKAFARTPQHEEGAELATATIRYVLDEGEWKAISPQVGLDGAVDGIGGIELEIEPGDQGDPDINFEPIDVQSFFYDPRSYKDDFSDARYMGIGKWLDIDIAREMFPDSDPEAFQADDELTGDTDRERRWFSSDGVNQRCRIVDIWYKHKSGWCWAVFSGNSVLMEGKSYFQDENNKDFCKYLMFSGNVDHDGDRYGFVRNMKSAQDGINAKQSKMQHILVSRRLIMSRGAVDDVEAVRKEWARPDGVVITNAANVNEGVKAEDQSTDFAGWEKLLILNQNEIDQYGPNAALVGTEADAKSGRALALLQQAGMAELGPYILAYRGWKVRVYRAIWNALQRHWKAERWIRVTDDEGLAQFIQINGMQSGPDGTPSIVNAIGSLDVDIIIDEGPDSVTAMQDMYETLSNVVPAIAPMLQPQQAQAVVNMLIETSPLASAQKKKFRDASEAASQPDPMAEQAKMAELQKLVGEGQEKIANAELKQAQTAKTYVEAQMHPQMVQNEGLAAMGMPVQGGEYELPPELQEAQAVADIEKTYSEVEKNRSTAFKQEQEGALAPQQMVLEQQNAQADRQINMQNAEADRNLQAKNADADRKVKAQQARMKPKGK
jgi:hypothetical protein